jgi:anthranilate synthase component 1
MTPIAPTFDRFAQLASEYNSIPVLATLICDDMTPLSAFARLQADSPRAFLLESVVGGESVARYSFLGTDPAQTCAVTRDRVRLLEHASGRVREQTSADPLAVLESLLQAYHAPAWPGLPRFLGGAVGYASYDTVRYYERLPHAPADDRGLPDLLFDLYETMVVFDHAQKIVLVVAHARTTPGGDAGELRAAYDAAAARIENLMARLSKPSRLKPLGIALPSPATDRLVSNMTPAAFEAVVAKCQEYIRAGDIFQVVPSQRLLVETKAEPLNIYRALRVINPSPFMFYLKSPEVVLVGASPEIMCRVEDGVVTNRPLAGTRKRGATEDEDRRLREELLADPKERAEHVMLVDLGRNDVGRVARPGSVRISDVMTVEYYSHVMHISSTVTGELAPGRTAFDALRAALPVGTVSGAPKVRAMEIIDECEPTRRGPYAGAIGYIDFAGNMDTCIALRTLVVQPGPKGRHRAYVQVGAGIVADSVPRHEFQETMNKAQSLLAAIRMAEEQFVRPRRQGGGTR